MDLSKLFSALLLCICTLAFAQQQHPFVNLSPLPNSQYHNIHSSIIIRLGYDVSEQTKNLLQNTAVEGTQSGKVPFRLRIARDNKVAVLKPTRPFRPNEQVTVRFDANLLDKTLHPIGDFQFSFKTSAQRTPDPLTYPSPELTPSRTDDDTDTLPTDYLSFHQYGEIDTNQYYMIGLPTYGYHDLLMLKATGEPVFLYKAPVGLNDFRVQNDSTLSFSVSERPELGLVPRYGLMNCKQKITQFVTMLDGYEWTCSKHEMLILPNGNALLIGEDTQIVDMSQLVPNGSPNQIVLGNTLQEIDFHDTLVVWQWRTWDHFNILDATNMGFVNTPKINSAHINALELDTDGNLLVSAYSRDEISKINYQTGEIMWMMGGKNNQFTFINDPTNGTSRQHDIRRLPNGHITLFDNGIFHPDKKTRLKEYALDEMNKTATLVWSVLSPNTTTLAAGSHRQLSNGNHLAGWGAQMAMANPVLATEFAPDSTVVFEIKTTQAPLLTQLAYRVYKFPWQWCTIVSALDQTFGKGITCIALPNPAHNNLNIRIETTEPLRNTTLSIFNQNAQLIERQKLGDVFETYIHPIDLQNYPVGTYFFQINADNKSKTGKFVVQ